MGFQKIPSSTLLHLYFGSLFASDGQTDGRTACPFLGALCFDNHPFGVDNAFVFGFSSGSFLQLWFGFLVRCLCKAAHLLNLCLLINQSIHYINVSRPYFVGSIFSRMLLNRWPAFRGLPRAWSKSFFFWSLVLVQIIIILLRCCKKEVVQY